LIIALPTPLQEPLSKADILKAREDQQKKDMYDLEAEKQKQAVRAEEFSKQIKIKDDEAATKALVVKIGKERQAAIQQQQLSQLGSEDTFQQSAQVRADLSAVATVGQQITQQQQQQQLQLQAEMVNILPDDGSNSDAAKVLQRHKVQKQVRRHEELENILNEIRELKRDLQVMKHMKKNKENYDRVHLIQTVAQDARDLADRVKQLRLRPPSLEWDEAEIKELRELSYSRQQKQERAQLENEVAHGREELLSAEGQYNMTKDHLLAQKQQRK